MAISDAVVLCAALAGLIFGVLLCVIVCLSLR